MMDIVQLEKDVRQTAGHLNDKKRKGETHKTVTIDGLLTYCDKMQEAYKEIKTIRKALERKNANIDHLHAKLKEAESALATQINIYEAQEKEFETVRKSYSRTLVQNAEYITELEQKIKKSECEIKEKTTILNNLNTRLSEMWEQSS